MSKLRGLDGREMSSAKIIPKIRNVRPAGTQVLVELLTAQEALGTYLAVTDNATINGAPQGYIRDLGPKVPVDYGFSPNDRVILHGNYTPLPEGGAIERENSHRPLILVEPHQIKAVLEEANGS